MNEITGFISSLVGDKNSGITKIVTENLQPTPSVRPVSSWLIKRSLDVPLQEQPRWRELNPRAQDEVRALMAQRSTRLAGEIYNAEVASRPILLQPSEGNPELQARQAKARAEAMAIAREKSGFGAVSPYLQMQNGPQLMQYTAAVDGAIYKGRAKNADDQRQATDVNLISSAVEKFESDGAVYESASDRVAALKQILQEQAERLSRDYPTALVSDLMGRALAEQLPDIIQSADERNLTLADLKALALRRSWSTARTSGMLPINRASHCGCG